ncbi:ASCH domain-containing protein [bacterium NHP-B]|nr:ASCH domain-containing protein [bacterium NHP-B]
MYVMLMRCLGMLLMVGHVCGAWAMPSRNHHDKTDFSYQGHTKPWHKERGVYKKYRKPFQKRVSQHVKKTWDKECTLRKIYIDAIRSGKKTIEGRLNKPHFQKLNVQKGETLLFHPQNPSQGVLCRVENVFSYKNFGHMLRKHRFQECVPESKTAKEAWDAYCKIYSLEDQEKYGVLAWQISLINP